MGEIKAIETSYKGYRFRSRLEARWAVFFDALGVKWEYEKEGYDLGSAGWYLPDFWFPELRYWIEIKPDNGSVMEDVAKLTAFASAVEADKQVKFFVLLDTPGIEFPAPNVDLPTYCTCRFESGVLKRTGKQWVMCPLCGRRSLSAPFSPCSGEWALYCWPCDAGETDMPLSGESNFFHKGDSCTTEPANIFPLVAYRAARSARFEHGETPR